MAIGQGNVAEALDYSTIKEKVDKILGDGDGMFGYGQLITSPVIIKTNNITVNEWNALRSDMIRIRQHQSGISVGNLLTVNGVIDLSGNNLYQIVAGDIMTNDIRAQYSAFANIITTNKFLTVASQQSTESLVNGVRTSNWAGTISHQIVVYGSPLGNGSADNLRYFFNSGGYLTISPSFVAGNTAQLNTDWTKFLSRIGNIKFDYTSISASGVSSSSIFNSPSLTRGFYDLTTTDTPIFTMASGIMKYEILARLNLNSTQITFTINFTSNSALNVSGILYSTMNSVKATGSNVQVLSLTAGHSGLDEGAAPSLFQLTPSATTVNEGSIIYFSVQSSSTGVQPVYWEIYGGVNSDDFTGATLSGSIMLDVNGSGTIAISVNSDKTTEGSEQFRMRIRTDSASGPIVATSGNITINDTSLYQFSLSATTLHSNDSVSLTITTATGRSDMLFITKYGSISDTVFVGGFQPVIANFTTSSTKTFTIIPSLPSLFNDTFNIQVRTGNSNGPVVWTSPTITVTDTEKRYSIGKMVGSTFNTTLGDILQSGDSFSFVVHTTNVPNGTVLPYALVGISSTVISSGFTGNITITNNSGTGSFTVNPSRTDGTQQSFIISLLDSGNVVATSSSIYLSAKGSKTFITSGTWVAPTGVTKGTVEVVGGGGGGGTAHELGNGGGGGGGGSGGVSRAPIVLVGGELVIFSIGLGGAGGKTGGRGTVHDGKEGGKSEFRSKNAYFTAAGGFGGGGGRDSKGGAGGAGGVIGGVAGTNGASGTNDRSSGKGGIGGSNSTPYGRGGDGAAFKDRTEPLGWSGFPGGNGAVTITWG